ncbi:hypothetical protein AIOGIFDO_01745 [Candidatus Methanoperedenaceae archaeon GB37]|nr:hypothetical protein AIOGIFDO_01745 [Candidatus Methanoperedenaceae archaeon GB37]
MSSRDGKKKLLEKVYKLGQEVGYFSHSEVGWVHREYRRIQTEGEKLGIALKIIKECYEKGKSEGAYRKQHDITRGIGKKTIKQSGKKVKVGKITTQKDREENTRRTHKVSLKPILTAVDRPQSARKPTFIHRIRTTLEPTLTRLTSPYKQR